ncbi:MFS transporter [Dethiosulfatarculus sandiegensis]|uniref:Major facilitator superfamily (MFS) profile domain-containing protein n=1 Tax=Dethiosulfatarculus sandiegensis TaxID=1429043 RepID=A0A0D2HQW8_9BACT|nr:MFS transporter [Dethiosulfatarculus sandiegensis]KIX12873.1 hypothetical protein X474_16835 [Dethiosulfatarculus sandiegensis]
MSSSQETITLTSDSKKIFYGWWVLAGCIIVALCSSIARFGFSMFMPYILTDFGWTRAMVSGAFTLHMAVYAVSAVFVGRLVDRFGARWVMFGGSVLLLIGMFMHSRMSAQIEIYLYYSIISGFGVAGTLVVPNVTTARKWFRKKAGMSIGLVLAGSGMGVVVAGILVPFLSTSVGWRNAYVVFAVICGLAGMAASQLVRKDPESMGLKPDGIDAGEATSGATGETPLTAVSDEAAWTVREALKTKVFWILIFIYIFSLIPSLGFISNACAFGQDIAAASGVDIAVSGPMIGKVFMLMGIMIVIGEILSGYLVDRFGKKEMLIISTILICLCFLWAMSLKTMGSYLAFMMVYGFSFGLNVPAWVPLMADCFGRKSLGALYGILTLFGGGLSGLGGVLFGGIFDATKSYDGAFWTVIAMLILVIVGITQIRPVSKELGA